MAPWGPYPGRLAPSSQASYGNISGAQATALEFTQINPTLGKFVLGFESDTGRLKIGDGVTDWNNLPYFRIDTLDDVIIDDATKGLVLKDDASPAHYWRVTINSSGVLQQTDLGTTKP